MDRYHEVKQSKTTRWQPSATAIVCRKHFSVEDYKETLLGMYVLCMFMFPHVKHYYYTTANFTIHTLVEVIIYKLTLHPNTILYNLFIFIKSFLCCSRNISSNAT